MISDTVNVYISTLMCKKSLCRPPRPPELKVIEKKTKNTYTAPSGHLILCTSVHVAGLQGGRGLSVGGADSVCHHTGPRGIMGDALHPAHLRASATAHRAGVPLTGPPAEKATEVRGQRSADLHTCCQSTVNDVGTCLHGGQFGKATFRTMKTVFRVDNRWLDGQSCALQRFQ